MKKIKFLSFAAMAAFVAVSLTSCEKEDFTTDVEAPEVNVPTITIPGITIPEGYQPGDAVISIQPTVIGVISATEGWDTESATEIITDKCTITYNGNSTFTYALNADRGVDAMSVEIKADYTLNINGFTNVYSATHTVNIPALSAGMVAVVTPTLMINASGEVSNPYTTVSYEVISENPVSDAIELVNNTNYWYSNFSKEYSYEMGFTNVQSEIIDEYKDNTTLANYIANITRWNGLSTNTVTFEIDYLWADSSIKIPYTQYNCTYKNVYAVDVEWGRAAETKEIATVTWDEIGMMIFDLDKANWVYSTDSHGHSHSHGDGHGDAANAGGGIAWGE